jgi:hypothetical protein
MCQTALKGKLLIKNNPNDAKDKLIWKFIKGTTSTTQADFADPEASASYVLCIYEDVNSTPDLKGTLHVPPNSAKWNPISTKGYKYLDATVAASGVQKIIVKSSSTGKTKAIVKAKGSMMPPIINTGPTLVLPVRAQLYNYGTGKCWEGTFTTPKKNDTVIFKAKQ